MKVKSREEDLKELHRLLFYARSRTARTAIEKSIWQIEHEDHMVASMREELINATRNSDFDRIKDIHDYVSHNRKYQAQQ